MMSRDSVPLYSVMIQSLHTAAKLIRWPGASQAKTYWPHDTKIGLFAKFSIRIAMLKALI